MCNWDRATVIHFANSIILLSLEGSRRLHDNPVRYLRFNTYLLYYLVDASMYELLAILGQLRVIIPRD